MGVEAVVGGAVVGGLVLGNRISVCGQGLQIGRRPVLVAAHSFVRLFVQRRRDVKMWPLENSVGPGDWPPFF